MDYAFDEFQTDGILVWNLVPGLEIIEITKDGITNPSHDTLVRYLQDEVKTTLKVFGFNEQVLTIPPRAQNCFNFTMDFMSYLELEITEEIIGATAKSESRGCDDLFFYLMEQSRGRIPMSADLIESLVGSGTFSEKEVQRLIERHGNEVPITTEILEEARTSGDAPATCYMNLFLEIAGAEKHVTTKLLQYMATGFSNSKSLIPKLFWGGLKEHVDSDDVLKEWLIGQCGDWYDSDEDVFKMLLNYRQGQVNVKEFEVIANDYGFKEALELIHAHNDSQTVVTQVDRSTT